MLRQSTNFLKFIVPFPIKTGSITKYGRSFSSISGEWEAKFRESIKDVKHDISHEKSAEILRNLVGTGLLKHTDLRDQPNKFFEAQYVG